MAKENKSVSKVPNLRFPGFEEEWEKIKLGEIATFSKGKGISKSDVDDAGINKCIRYGELYTQYGETIDNVKSKTNLDLATLILSESNDVIIPASGESVKDIATASCVLKPGIALGGDLNIIKTKNNGVFLSYYLNYKKKFEIANLAQGISVVHLYSSQLRSLSLNLPQLEEQRRISTFLTLLDKRIQTQNKIIDNLNSQMLGLQEKIFRQKIKFVNENGKYFPSWETRSGGEVFINISNKIHHSDLPILAVTQNHGAVPRSLIDYQISVTDKSIEGYKVVDIGDFIISLRSFQGGIEYSNYKGICSPAYIILRNKLDIENLFYKYYFKTKDYITLLNRKLEGIRDGKMISYSYFSDIGLPYPTKKEQTVIGNILSQIDQKIELEKKILQQYEKQKKYLLRNLFI
jgi:type I restriction enzyme S subunit